MGNGSGSAMVRRQLGRKLKRLREEARKTQADVEEARIASVTKVNRIEGGKVPVKPGDVYALAHLYDLPGNVTDALAAMAAGTRDDGWFEVYRRAVPEWLGIYAGLEGGASAIHAYHPELVHGLLQTSDYARAIISIDSELAAAKVEQLVAFRLARQEAVFGRGRPARVEVILGAGALALVVGSAELLRDQVRHLRELSARGVACVRVLPFAAGPHLDMNGAFTLMDFTGPDDPDTVHVETYVGSTYLGRPDQVERFRGTFEMLTKKSVPIEEFIA
jgi:transcriptional regulator with XRE-family HTH domain